MFGLLRSGLQRIYSITFSVICPTVGGGDETEWSEVRGR